MRQLIERPRQLERLLAFRDTDLVKVVTGIRRCGKSSLLELARQAIEAEGVEGRGFLSVNLEDLECGVNTADDLYALCKGAMMPQGRTYLFIDEIQRIEGWHNVVNSLRVHFDCDIYLTGSNAFLLSGELSTYLSGRYVEVHLLPLSFEEYATFCRLRPNSTGSLMLPESGDPVLTDDLLDRYLAFGGMPALASLATTQAQHGAYMASLVDSIIVRDIMSRERNASERRLASEDLLRSICTFLADNIGNRTSANKIAGATGTTDKTAGSYVRALDDAYIFYPVARYDLHGKEILKTLPKQYIADLGVRAYLLGYRPADKGRALENAVYLQLIADGWSVHVGTLYGKEVDFVCVRDGVIRYVQVTEDMTSPATMERELAPYKTLNDNHEKIVVVRTGNYPADINGVRIVMARKFLLEHH